MTNEPNPNEDILSAMGAIESRRPWERLPDEKPKHYEWFHHYCVSGPNRSVRASYLHFRVKSQQVAKSVSGVSSTWLAMAVKFDWKARAQAWDEEQQRIREAAWHARQEDFQQKSFELAERMMAKAAQMIGMPLVKTETDQNGNVVTIMPARWTFDTVPRLVAGAEAIVKLQQGQEALRLLKELDAIDNDHLVTAAKDIIEDSG